jgi:hypothetical protein
MYIFVTSPGRSGTKYLSELFKNYPPKIKNTYPGKRIGSIDVKGEINLF